MSDQLPPCLSEDDACSVYPAGAGKQARSKCRQRELHDEGNVDQAALLEHCQTLAVRREGFQDV